MSDYAAFKREFSRRYTSPWVFAHALPANRFSIRNPRLAPAKIERIFTHAFALSQRHGFKAMTVRMLSRSCGVSTGGLYAYIRSKTPMADVIGQTLYALAQAHFEPIINGPGSARERLTQLLRTHLHLSERMQPWYYFSFMECRHLNPPQRKAALASEQWVETHLLQLLKAGQMAGEFTCHDAEFTATMLKPMLQDWYLKTWKYSARSIDVDQYCERLLQLLDRILHHESEHPNSGP